ncbi:MAG TPA: restriction endonuclease subunit S [Hanamia sp.]|nr:restriction endonuclease subunit S [Hanamia sp.]
MKSNYKKIGDHIREVNVRNKELQSNNLLGINIDKYYMPSVANIIGTDMTAYKVVKQGQFACNRMHVGRDYRLPVALSKSKDDFIVSPAYDVFEIIDEKVLLPEYLMMWFSRKDFDRNAWFYTDADVRGGLPWKSFCEMDIPIPHPDKQKEIVKEYNTIVNRIALNNQLIQKLEEAAQSIYKQWFVDFEFPDEEGKPYKSNGGEMVESELGEIPSGWEVKPFTKVLKLSGGGTPDTSNEKYWGEEIPFFAPPDVSESYYAIKTEKNITEKGLKNCSSKLYPQDTIFVTARGTVGAIAIAGCEMAMNQSCYAITDTKRNSKYFPHQLTVDTISRLKNEATGAVFSALVTRDFEGQNIIEPNENLILKFDVVIKGLYDSILNIEKENFCLSAMKDLLLSKLATIEN